MLEKGQFESLIERTLHTIGLYSKSATELLLGTAAQESRLGTYLRQVGGGPALGFFQMEPATHDDAWINYLYYHEPLAKKIYAFVCGSGLIGRAAQLEWNLAYAIVMARVHYLRRPGALPHADDVRGQAEYWKRYWNTEKGAGTIEQYIENHRRYLGR